MAAKFLPLFGDLGAGEWLAGVVRKYGRKLRHSPLLSLHVRQYILTRLGNIRAYKDESENRRRTKHESAGCGDANALVARGI